MHPVLETPLGAVRGERLPDGTCAFRGLPYAAPTSGAGRWAPPRPPAPWTGTRDATRPGPICPQPARPFSEWAHGPLAPTGEDSIAVHVWTPEDPAVARRDPRPVLVFLHGGGWALGWGSNPLLDGTHLARALDAVVVTVNYRLGSLGWLWHPDLAAEPGAPAGNWGLLDQLAALRWVAANASAFGGDPERVTLGGESAGAGSVMHLLTHPETDGLFTRAIAQSPPLHELVVAADLGRAWTEALAAHLTHDATSVAAALPALRALPAEAVVAAHEDLLAGDAFRGTRGGAMPIVDPASLPADPARAPGARPHIPVLIGTNADEGTFFFRAGGRRLEPDEDRLRDMVAHLAHSDHPERLITRAREAGAATANDALCAIVTEAWFAAPVRRWSAARAEAGATVHRYRVDHPAAENDLGATHSIDVPLLFATWRDGGVAARLAGTGSETAAVSEAMAADWRRFVHGETLEWAPVSEGTEAAVVYGGESGPRTITQAGAPARA